VSYFSINSAKKIIKKLWQHVASDGKLVFTNAHPDNPTRLWMEFIGEWFLEYKDKQMMIKIAQDLDKIKDMDYRIDRYGVYQYLVIHHE
jgi:hypothetical protein